MRLNNVLKKRYPIQIDRQTVRTFLIVAFYTNEIELVSMNSNHTKLPNQHSYAYAGFRNDISSVLLL